MNEDDDEYLIPTAALATMLLAALGMLVLAYILMPGAAGATECRERPGSRSHWNYRIIDGQRCWFRGHRMAKSRLHWPEEEKPKEIVEPPPIDKVRAELTGLDGVTWYMMRSFDEARPFDPQPLYDPPFTFEQECCWPPLTEFDKRFVGERQ